ncbi:DUF6374 family protein [Nocardia wallacei]|uniref:DUF6374 family protein n=1 Tax=Nocardia wallacei TaxID=480035 RepID=UPI0024546ED2|nr:DUF6374 family protein [Nocardia wallacei]
MPARPTITFARQQIEDVRRQLLDAAAFGKHITPDQLERMAGKLAYSVRALDDQQHAMRASPGAVHPPLGDR